MTLRRLGSSVDTRSLSRGLELLRRDVYHLQRRVGPPTIAEQLRADPLQVSGPFEFDFLIDNRYQGPEGQETLTSHGHTYKTYASLELAVADANANRQATGQSSSFWIVGTGTVAGQYQIANTISLNPPTSGSYHLYGSGADTTSIVGVMTSGDLFSVPTQVLDSVVEFHHMEMRTIQPIDLIDGGGSTRIALDNCWLRPENSSAIAINPGNAGVGWNVSNTNIEGGGDGVRGGTTYSMRLSNCYVACRVGVDLSNDTQFYGTTIRFACTTTDVNIGATAGSLLFDIGVCEINKGIRFDAGGAAIFFDTFIVNGCTFFLGSSEVGINYADPLAGAGDLVSSNSHSLVGNSFYTASGSAEGIRGGTALADGPKHVAVVANSFRGFTSGNEIIDMDRSADENEIAHNTTDSGATLPNTGTGHALPGSGLSLNAAGEFVTSVTKPQAHAVAVR